MLSALIGAIIGGLIVGALGRLALPGRQDMGVGSTILVGIGGSFIGTLISVFLPGDARGLSGLIFGVIGAVVILAVLRRSGRTT